MRFICVQRLRFGKISRKTTVTASTKVALWLQTAKNTSLFTPEVKRLKAIVASEQMNIRMGLSPTTSRHTAKMRAIKLQCVRSLRHLSRIKAIERDVTRHIATD